MPVGSYTLTATPYTGAGGTGTAGTTLTRSFNVVDNGKTLLLTRGPYLQMGNQTGITLRWRTNMASDSWVALGTSPGNYPLVVSDPALSTEYEVRMHGLSAATRYYYQLGSATQVLQGGTDNFFATAPAAGNPDKVRVAVFGDCGRNLNNVQGRTLTAYRNYVGSTQSGWPHNALPFSDNGGGMFYLEIEQNRLDARYLRADGVVWDQFTIMKEVNTTVALTLPANTPTQLTASWLGDYQWSTGEVTRSITVSPGTNTSFQVSDGRGCLTDVFQVTVDPAGLLATNKGEQQARPGYSLVVPQIHPTLLSRGGRVFVQVPEKGAWLAEVMDLNGQVVYRSDFHDFTYLATSSLLPGR